MNHVDLIDKTTLAPPCIKLTSSPESIFHFDAEDPTPSALIDGAVWTELLKIRPSKKKSLQLDGGDETIHPQGHDATARALSLVLTPENTAPLTLDSPFTAPRRSGSRS